MAVLIASSWYSFSAYSRHLRKIESAEAQTRSIIEYTLDGIITMNDQGLVQSMNPAAEKMFGYPRRNWWGNRSRRSSRSGSSCMTWRRWDAGR
jgi:PAS domain-containing protein